MAGSLSPFGDRVLGIDDEEAAVVLTALTTESARQVLAVLNEDPATVSELSDRTGLTAQNVSYHLGKLTEADLVRVYGMRRAGGNEATVYAPTKSIVVTTETNVDRRRLQMLVGIIGFMIGVFLILAVLHSVVEPSVGLRSGAEHNLEFIISLF